jgi:hypothetical protein
VKNASHPLTKAFQPTAAARPADDEVNDQRSTQVKASAAFSGFPLDTKLFDAHSQFREPSRQMPTIKVIAGLCCMVAALFLGCFAWVSFLYGVLWVKFVPAVFTLGLVSIGLFLIWKRRSTFSTRVKVMIAAFAALFVLTPTVLVVHIRHERTALQMRAKELLSRPVPMVFQTNYIGGYQARENQDVLFVSRNLIKRYADNGRIRWSARISGQMAVQHFETAFCEDADIVKANEEARLYVAECRAIIEDEWRMGFWQWVEDTIEMKRAIPEIEEEDFKPAVSTNEASLQQ